MNTKNNYNDDLRHTHARDSKLAITRDRFVNKVAEALCREWYGDRDMELNAVDSNHHSADARFWEEFRHESQIAILAYLDALEEAGYRVIRPDDARR